MLPESILELTFELSHLRINILFVTCSKTKPNYLCLLTVHAEENFYIQIHCISTDSATLGLTAKWKHYEAMNLYFILFYSSFFEV